ncbi:hypothetical protein BDM02DRAFT_3124967 [Thelephora ganbajun]|uniref:Uncharacterized protein n=1 Tax=Thelephora ganbajun TaxID=370292 RepID=A0ACB6YXN8_THEGA|nr:hypothetical protein BDM02DRAFT_3124967 [Thelephora ganbajun]
MSTTHWIRIPPVAKASLTSLFTMPMPHSICSLLMSSLIAGSGRGLGIGCSSRRLRRRASPFAGAYRGEPECGSSAL